ncbi:MAG: DNA polymerase/3'-5' exonuclease PolX [Chloroflexi bacterium]|nr:DNA polymerase/3'-5' exonuclease PolX [Chloroflexota bacterium]
MANAKSAKKTKPAKKATSAKTREIRETKGNGAAAPPAPLKSKWTNQEIATLLYRIGDILELQGETVFKVIAYRRAADSIEHLGRNVQDIWAGDPKNLRAINGVGEAIALKIDELFRTGHMSYYEKISKDIPSGLFELLTIPGIGPKTVMRLWKDLNITDVISLEAGVRAGKLRDLAGFGAKSEEKILAGIDAQRRKKSSTRVLLGRALPFAEVVVAALREACGSMCEHIEAAGSLRRMRATIGDIDIVVASDKPDKVIDAFVHLPQVREVNAQGGTKASIVAGNGMQVDLRVLEPARWGTALQYFTGSKEHSIELRQIALDQGLSLSEWDFKNLKTGKEILLAREEEVYEKLGMSWIPPELREATGEIRAAQKRRLPHLIELRDLKGDLQSHSKWSDGGYTIEQMAQAAQARGLHYLALTDHSKGLGVARGLDFERAKLEWAEIDQVNARLKDFRILKGIEVEIHADGSMDLPDEALAQFDLVLGSTHSALGQSREQMTARVIKALRNPYVDIFAHPTGRLIGTREPSALDLEELFKVAQETGTILEINGSPERLDLSDVHARRARTGHSHYYKQRRTFARRL